MRQTSWWRRKSAGPRPSLIIGLAWAGLLAFVIIGIAAPWIAPYGETQQFLADRLSPPLTPGYLLGTDALGRDILTRLIYGARISLLIGFATVIFTAILGVAIGLVSGYIGGKVDTVIMRVIDIWLAFPFLLMAIALVAVIGRGMDKLVLAFVVSGWTAFARPVRGEVLQLREREFTMSARVLGVSRFGIMFKHLLPNVMPTILVLAALDLGYTILGLASLSFLGLGLGAEVATWGGMLADGRNYVASAWWLATVPGLAIFVVVMAVNLIGDWIRDRYDPRSPFRKAKTDSALDETGAAADRTRAALDPVAIEQPIG